MAVKTFFAAFKFLTIWGCFSTVKPAPGTVGKAAGYFPCVGLALGLLLALTNYILSPYFGTEILNLIVLTFLIAATGAQHLTGMKATFDAFAANDESANRTLGFTAVVLVIVFKSAAADSMDINLTLSWLLTPVLARWALVIFLYGYHSRFEGPARAIAEHVNTRPVLASTVFTLVLAVYFLGRRGLWLALVVSVFTLSLRTLLHRRQTVLSQANWGATVELAEVVSLVVLASF